MKRILFFALILLLTLTIIAEDYLQSTFNDATQAYQNKEWQQALDLFLSVKNENIKQADLNYNIGNCYFQLQELGKAILYYKRSLKISPGHEQAKNNLALALSLTQDKQQIEETDFLAKIWNTFITFFHLNSLAVILTFLFFFIIMLINIMIIHYRKREKTTPMFLLLLFIFLFAFFSVLAIAQWNRYHDDTKAVLMQSTEIGYSGPSEEFTRVFTIHEGMIFEIEKSESEWSLIKLPNGIGGWIPTNSFERI